MPKPMPFSDDVLYLNPGLAKQAKTARAKSNKPKRADGFDSDLERDYALELTARGLLWHYHTLTLNLGSGLTYTPDFDYLDPRGFTVIIEVKGSRRMKNARDSLTRWKVAAAMYPQHHWLWVERFDDGRWDERPARFDRTISTEMPRPSAGAAQSPLGLTPAQTAVARRLGLSLATLHEVVFGAAASQFTDDDLIRAVGLLTAQVPAAVLQRLQAGEWTFPPAKVGD
jgi:hypothetical protein